MPDDYSDLLMPVIIRHDDPEFSIFLGDPSDAGKHILTSIVDDPNEFIPSTEPRGLTF